MRTNKHVYGEPSFWVKGEEARMAKGRRLTVILREKDRSSREVAPKQWLPLFEPVPVYYLDAASMGGPGTPLSFEPDDGTTVQVVRRTVGRLGDITHHDLSFQGGRAVPYGTYSPTKYFEEEMSPGWKFPPETVITVYWLEYLPDEEPAKD